MKKKLIISICLIGTLFFNVYANNEIYKQELVEKLLKNMNETLEKLQKNEKITKDEIIPIIQPKLETLRDTYNKNDFEYEVIQDLIDSLSVEEWQREEKSEENENWQINEESWENQWNEQQQSQNETQPRWPSIKIDENALDSTKQLSPQEKEAVEAYLKELQEEEKNNIHLNKPREQRDIFDILKDDFMFDNLNTNQNWW